MGEEEKKRLKAGDVVGVVSLELQESFRIAENKEIAIWSELSVLTDERRKLWTQLEKDGNLPKNYSYRFNRDGKIRVIRELTQSEVRWAKLREEEEVKYE